MRAFPAIRTRPVPDWGTAFAFCAKSGGGMIVLAIGLGLACFGLAALVRLLGDYASLTTNIEAAGLLFLLSPALTVPVMICSTPFITLVARAGFAGWAVACAWGIAASVLALWTLEKFVWNSEMATTGAAAGAVLGALFWVASKFFCADIVTAQRQPAPKARS